MNDCNRSLTMEDRQNQLTLTVNERLAKHMQIIALESTGKTIDSDLNIQSFNSWLFELWSEVGTTVVLPTVLPAEVIQTFWHDAIQILSPELLDISKAAKKASQASSILKQWKVCISDFPEYISDDVAMFKRWLSGFELLLQDHNAITANDLIDHILKNSENCTFPHAINLIGFDDVPPQTKHFLDALTQRGVKVNFTDEVSAVNSVEAFECISIQDEYRQALTWAKSQRSGSLRSQIGIIIPNLHVVYPTIQRFALEVLCGEKFTISGGMPLREYPLVHQALGVLREIKSIQQPLSKHLNVYLDKLKAERWPAETTLSSHNHQIIGAFFHVIETLSKLDVIFGDISGYEAHKILTQWLNQPFQGEDDPDAGIHILGLLEAAPLSFDAVWICGLSDDILPPRPDPNPFIPYELQVEKEMPKSSSERELSLSQNLFNRICAQNKIVRVSYPLFEGDILKSRSSLITVDVEKLQPLQTDLEQCYQPIILDKYTDSQAPVISDSEKSSMHGGSGIIAKQAACPFQAFAHTRLRVKSPEPETPYLEPKDRGTILHEILERFWKETQTQSELLSLRQDDLENRVSGYVDLVLKRLRASYPSNNGIIPANAGTQDTQFIALEKKRLNILILAWLEFEKSRPSFEVREQEKEIIATISGLPIKLRIDRVDRLENDALLLIDYKTGRTNVMQWFGDRLEAPQLPLYATLMEVDGLAFADLSGREPTFKGVANDDLGLDGVVEPGKLRGLNYNDFSEIVSVWKTCISHLAEAFLSGDAKVDPTVNACRYCGLEALCRKDEL